MHAYFFIFFKGIEKFYKQNQNNKLSQLFKNKIITSYTDVSSIKNIELSISKNFRLIIII